MNIYWIDPTNGNVQFLNMLSTAFSKRGHNVTIITNLLKDFPPPSDICLHAFSTMSGLSSAPKNLITKFGMGFFYPFDWVRTAIWARLKGCRVVLMTSNLKLPELDALGLVILRAMGIIPVIISHRPHPDYYQNNSSKEMLRYRPFFMLAKRILVMSSYNLELSVRELRIPRKKFTKVPHPHFNEYLENVLPDIALANKLKKLTFKGPLISLVSQDTPEHGIETFFNALPILRRMIPNANIAVFSRICEGDRMVKFHNALENNFRGQYLFKTSFYTYNELVALLKATSLVVFPYNWMTQSGAAAMASGFGVPIISSNVGGMPEMISVGVSGELFPPNDPLALAEAAAHILKDCNFTKYKEGARLWSENEFNPSVTVDKICDTLTEIYEHR